MIVLDALVWVLKIVPTTLIIVGGAIDQPISFLGGLGHEGVPIEEPVHVVSGHRYGSLKVDLPFTERSLWYYAGDEPERDGGVDENTYTFRIHDFGDTVGLDGHESGEDCFLSREQVCKQCLNYGGGY